jgi:DNA polymerase-1
VHRWLREQQLRSRLVLQVHDELVFEVPDTEVELLARELPRLMTGVAQLSVPLVVDVGVGPNWDRAH